MTSRGKLITLYMMLVLVLSACAGAEPRIPPLNTDGEALHECTGTYQIYLGGSVTNAEICGIPYEQPNIVNHEASRQEIVRVLDDIMDILDCTSGFTLLDIDYHTQTIWIECRHG